MQQTSAALVSRSGNVHPLFDLSSPTTSPFPADCFSLADSSQITGRRINLPLPASCATSPQDCEDVAELNRLDGFNADPWISVPWDGDIDVSTIKGNIFLLPLGDVIDARTNAQPAGNASNAIPINRIVWNPLTRTIHGRPDVFLEEHTRYALVVRRQLRDAKGNPAAAAARFERFRANVSEAVAPDLGWYRQALLDAELAVSEIGVAPSDIVAMSVFTTRSLTHRRQKLNVDISSRPLPTAHLNIGPGGTRAVYPFAEIASVTMNLQTSTAGALTPTSLPLVGVRAAPGAVGFWAFGHFDAPDFLAHPGEYIPAIPTRTGAPVQQRTNTIHFALSVPSGSRPARGWPVVVFGFGNNGNRFRAIAELGSIPQSHGFAVISIENPGSGHGAASTLTLTLKDGGSTTIPAPGRGFDQDGDGLITSQEGDRPIGINRTKQGDKADQFSSDLLSLVRAIQRGIDLDGNGTSDLDASRMYFLGQSGGSDGFGFATSTQLIRATALLTASPQVWDARMLNPASRTLIGAELASRTPPLINSAYGLTSVGGIAVAAPVFNENLPFRDNPPLVNTVPGSTPIQEWFERARWLAVEGSPISFARRARKSPLPGTTARPVLLFFAHGDQNATNPLSNEFIRAGDLSDRTVFYRHDRFYKTHPNAAKNPHNLWRFQGESNDEIAAAIQELVSQFFESDGARIPRVSPYFEAPAPGGLPEELGFIP